MNKDIENFKSIIDDLEDADDGAMINLSKEEIESLRNIYDYIERLEREIKRLKEDR